MLSCEYMFRSWRRRTLLANPPICWRKEETKNLFTPVFFRSRRRRRRNFILPLLFPPSNKNTERTLANSQTPPQAAVFSHFYSAGVISCVIPHFQFRFEFDFILFKFSECGWILSASAVQEASFTLFSGRFEWIVIAAVMSDGSSATQVSRPASLYRCWSY